MKKKIIVSPKEPYQSNIGVKMGSWFMTYELPAENKYNSMVEYIKRNSNF